MTTKVKRVLKYIAFVAGMLIIARLLKAFKSEDIFLTYLFEIVAFSIYMGLLTIWGAAILRRITNKVVKICLMISDTSLVLWFLARSYRYYIFDNPVFDRYMWYTYYFCLLISVLSFYVGMDCMVNKNRKKRVLNGFLMGIPTVVFSVLLYSNEFHNFIFVTQKVQGIGKYNVGFYVMTGWIFFLAFYSVLKLKVNFETYEYIKKAKWPFFVLAFALVFCVTYAFDVFPGGFLEYSITLFCIVAGLWESVIVTGMISSNVEYKWCFTHSVINSQILDRNGNSVYKSTFATPIVPSEFEELKENGYVLHDANTEIRMAEIDGGYVVWERDIHDINELIEKLKDTEKSMEEASSVIRDSIEIEARKRKTEHKLRLYDMMFSQVGDTVSRLEYMIKETEHLNGEELWKALVRIDVAGVYLKRKCNLILLNEQNLDDFTKELELCFKESFDNLADAGVNGNFYFNGVSGIDHLCAFGIYEALDRVLESLVGNMYEVVCILNDYRSSYGMVSMRSAAKVAKKPTS